MNNKATIFLLTLFAVAGASQLCASGRTSKETWDETLVRYTKKTCYVLGRVDQYSHGATTAFAACCVAPWLAFKGQKTEAIKLGAGALGNLGLRLLGDIGKDRFERWAQKKTGPTRFDSVKYQSLWYPVPFVAINLLQNSLRQHLTENILGSIAAASRDSSLDKYIVLGGVAFGVGSLLLNYVSLVRNLVVGVGLKMLGQSIEKNRYYSPELKNQFNNNIHNINQIIANFKQNKAASFK